jgi:hypothetical protein
MKYPVNKLCFTSLSHHILFFPGASEACDNAEDKDYVKFLSAFQIEKFTYMFNSFFDDSNGDGLLQKEDVDALIARLIKYRGK